jgi:hypothetical protein
MQEVIFREINNSVVKELYDTNSDHTPNIVNGYRWRTCSGSNTEQMKAEPLIGRMDSDGFSEVRGHIFDLNKTMTILKLTNHMCVNEYMYFKM